MKKWLIIIAALVVLAAVFRACQHKRQGKDSVEYAPVLKENEREKIIVDTRAGTIRTVARNVGDGKGIRHNGSSGYQTGEQTVTDISGVRKVAVTIDKNGNVEVYAPSKGVIFEPGLTAFYSEDRFRLGLDAQVFYWKRWGVNVGIGSTVQAPYSVKAYVAGSYNFYGNTSIFAGITQSKEIGFGVRVRF